MCSGVAVLTPDAAAVTGRNVVLMLTMAICICYIDRVNISVAAIAMQSELGWDDATKGFVLSSFFAGYLVLQFCGGYLANRFGGRLVLGVSVIAWSFFTLLTPMAAYSSLILLFIVRVLMGLGEGAAIPSGFNLINNRVPEDKKTEGIGWMMAGASIGTVTALLVTGWIVVNLGWPLAFYSFGLLGFVWAFFWFRMIPKDNPSNAVNLARKSPLADFPWRTVLRSPAIWMLLLASFTFGWTFSLFVAWLPSYYRDVFGISITASGLYAALPWLVLFLMQTMSSKIASRMMMSGMSRTATRKFMQGISQYGSAALLFLLPAIDSLNAALVAMCALFGFLAFTAPGYLANILDVLPKHGDIFSGFVSCLSSLAGLVAIAAAGIIIDYTESYNMVLLITAIMCAISATLYVIFATGEPLTRETGISIPERRVSGA